MSDNVPLQVLHYQHHGFPD